MTQTALDAEINLVLPLLGLDDKMTILEVMKSMITRPKSDNMRISIDQYNAEIEMAIAQVTTGNFTTHNDLEKEMELW